MTTQTTALQDFLLQMIADDETVAGKAPWEAAPPPAAWYLPVVSALDGSQIVATDSGHTVAQVQKDYARHVARHDPARVLAECAAKRRLVEEAADWQDRINDRETVGGRLLKLLALPYANRPDYRDEWRA